MKISEYIASLLKLELEHGDLDVQIGDSLRGRAYANKPNIAYTLVLNSRESKPQFWSPYVNNANGPGRRGQKVVRIG